MIELPGSVAENIDRFLRRTPLSFVVVHDIKRTAAAAYAPQKMPSSYVIDRKGVIRHVFSSQIRARKHVDEALAVVERLRA